MKMPNGYGSVYKLSGSRRNPWAARKTIGWSINPETGKSYPKYFFIGFYKIKNEALNALAEYNSNPDSFSTLTFGEVYEKWSNIHYPQIKSAYSYVAAHKLCAVIDNKRMADITLDDLQRVADESGKNEPVLRIYKIMLNQMFDYSIANGILPAERREMLRYLNVHGNGNPNARKAQIFSKNDIQKLWDCETEDEYISIILILIYTGTRINELLKLDKSDLHLDERYFYIRESKTASGIREVPISEKIVPLFEKWINKGNDCIFVNSEGRKLIYHTFYEKHWKPILDALEIKAATPHSSRHTFITLMTEAGVDERIIQSIVGHKGDNVTQIVYTHVTLPAKLDAVNKI